jgi:alanine dehydrogenase
VQRHTTASSVSSVPRETFAGEKRVATVPEVVEKLVKLGFQVRVESGAGDAANFADDTYRAAGAEVVGSAAELWGKSDIVFKVRPPTPAEVGLMREGGTLVDFIWPAQNPELMQQLAARKATVLAIDCLPRQLSRAQKMDALTSTAGVSGYRALEAKADGQPIEIIYWEEGVPLAHFLGVVPAKGCAKTGQPGAGALGRGGLGHQVAPLGYASLDVGRLKSLQPTKAAGASSVRDAGRGVKYA